MSSKIEMTRFDFTLMISTGLCLIGAAFWGGYMVKSENVSTSTSGAAPTAEKDYTIREIAKDQVYWVMMDRGNLTYLPHSQALGDGLAEVAKQYHLGTVTPIIIGGTTMALNVQVIPRGPGFTFGKE